MKLSSYTFSSPGGLKVNQDTAAGYEVNNSGIYFVGDSPDAQQMGAGSSDYVAENIIFAWRQAETPISPAWMQEQIGQIDRQLLWHGNENRRPMRSTAAVLSIIWDSAVWACTGGVRLFHFRNGRIIHAVNGRYLIQGDIGSGTGTVSEPYRTLEKKEDTRFLGSEDNWQLLTGSSTIQPGDAFLLSTDGFWKYVTDSEMLFDLLKSASLEEWGTHMLLRLMSRVNPCNDSFALTLISLDRFEA